MRVRVLEGWDLEANQTKKPTFEPVLVVTPWVIKHKKVH